MGRNAPNWSTGGALTRVPAPARSELPAVLATAAAAVEPSSDVEPLVLVADAQMRYLDANEAACRLLGYTLEELLTMRVPEVCVESDAADRYRRMQRDGRQDGRITLVCKDGRRVGASYEAREERSDDGVRYVSRLVVRKMRVVLADDDPSSRLLMSTLLSFLDEVEVVAEAADGIEAVEKVREHDPDLLLL